LSGFLISKATFIPLIFRYPVAFILIILGFALAFLPFEERSLDVWLTNFFRSIYKPTLYLWKTSGDLPDFLLYKPNTAHARNALLPDNYKPQLMQPYLQSIQNNPATPLDDYEQKRACNISNLFNIDTTTTPPNNSFQQQMPSPSQFTPQQKPSSINVTPSIVSPQQLPQSTQAAIPQGQTGPLITSAPTIQTPLKIKSLMPDTPLRIKIPELPPMFSEDQMPPVPDLPNTIVGAVMTPGGLMLANAIIEIRDATNMPIRAIKSNRLGQFFVATPLHNGQYSIVVEHDEHNFATINIEAKGNIIPPLKIVSIS